MSETRDVTSPLVTALNKLGCHALRINSGGYRGRMKGAPAGTPDILGSYRGKAFAVETKAKGGKLSESQRAWYLAHGHHYEYFVVDSVRDGVELVRKFVMNRPKNDARLVEVIYTVDEADERVVDALVAKRDALVGRKAV